MPINVKCFNNYSNVMSCLLSCLFSHWGPTFSNISAHLSTIRGRNDADKARCQASLAGSKCSNPRNSFEQLRTAWTQLDSSVMLPTPFKSLPKSNVVRTCLNCSAELCWALSCSVKLVGEVSHGNASGDSWVMLRRSPHWRAQPIANRCWTSAPGKWLHRIFFQHIDADCTYCIILQHLVQRV